MQITPQLKLSQSLVMTPQLQQAIKLLQLSRVELVDAIQQELLENPILEDAGEQLEKRVELSTLERQIRADERSGHEVAANEKKTTEIDWERYLENHALQAPMPGNGRGDDGLQSYEATASRTEDLSDHLTWQIQMSDLRDDEKAFAQLVVGNLDELGYLRIEGLREEEVVPKLAAESGLDCDDAEEVLKVIQRMEPVGAACRTLRECLLVQAEHLHMDPLVRTVLSDHLGDLEKRHYQAIARTLSVDVEEIHDVAQAIAELEPRPARGFSGDQPRYITPDIEVIKVGDGYVARTNDDGMPRLRISQFYRSALRGDASAKEYVQNKLRNAQWLIRSLEQRRKTIVKVTECIVARQRDFFEKGVAHLKPMILRDVADEVQLHESTVSRVTSNKYVSTPQGIYELKFFFNAGIRRANHEDIASESVKDAIKKIVAVEDPARPLSDQKIAEALAEQDILIARRTITKYRDILNIAGSGQRRRHF